MLKKAKAFCLASVGFLAAGSAQAALDAAAIQAGVDEYIADMTSMQGIVVPAIVTLSVLWLVVSVITKGFGQLRRG